MRQIINTHEELIEVLKTKGAELGQLTIDNWLELDQDDKKEYPLDLLIEDNRTDLDYIKENYGLEIKEFNPSLTDQKVSVEAKESIWNDYLEIYIDATKEVIKEYLKDNTSNQTVSNDAAKKD